MLIQLLVLGGVAVAQESSGSGSVLIGAGAAPGSGDPSTFVIGLRGEVPVATGDVLGLGIVFPLERASSGADAFGFTTTHMALEFAPSIRGRLLPGSVVRPYGDIGFGVVHRFSEIDSWFGDVTDNRTTLMARSALGLEIGGIEPGSVSLILEPIGYRHYGLDGSGADRFVALAGIQFGM
ncbi:MAG: hypothetical protein ABMB14_40180 [Myxococcota bacterium]